MDISLKALIHSFCGFFLSDDMCSLNFMPYKVKLIVAILLIPLILTVLYKKIISNHDHFEYFDNNKYKCCRKIPIIDNIKAFSQYNNIPNKRIVNIYFPNKTPNNIKILNSSCSTYDIDKNKINYLYRKKDNSHKYLGSRCLNNYSLTKKLMKKYNKGKKMFDPNYKLFYKV